MLDIMLLRKNIDLALDWLAQRERESLKLFEPADGVVSVSKRQRELQRVQLLMKFVVCDKMKEIEVTAEESGLDYVPIRLQLWWMLQIERQDCEVCKTHTRMIPLESQSDTKTAFTELLQVLASRRMCEMHENYYGFLNVIEKLKTLSEGENQLRVHGILELLPFNRENSLFYIPVTLVPDIYEWCDWYTTITAEDLCSGNDLLGRTMLHQVLDSHILPSEHALGTIISDGSEEPSRYDQQDCIGRTPLYTACQRGEACIVQLLLQRGADPTIASQDGYLPIHVAAAKGCQEICQLLINHSKQLLLSKGPDGESARDYALLNYHFAAANSLSCDYTHHAKSFPTRINHLLLQGILQGSAFVVGRALLDGANANTRFDPTYSGGRYVETALTTALQLRHEKFQIAEYLFVKGADLEAEIEKGETALHNCVKRRNVRGVEWLLDHSAALMARDAKGRTAFMIAAKKNLSTIMEMLYLMAQKNCTAVELVNAADDNGHTALDYAHWHGNTRCIELLEKYRSAIRTPRQMSAAATIDSGPDDDE